jgi:uncharacterized membrane protein
MVIMVLDHVRAYFTEVRFDPTDLTQTNGALFFTRWITHYCAPTFVFLAGASAWMAGTRRRRDELSRLLLSRGVWLILLEFTVISFGWYFNLRMERGLIAQVIWVIGASMVVLAGLVYLPRSAISRSSSFIRWSRGWRCWRWATWPDLWCSRAPPTLPPG